MAEFEIVKSYIESNRCYKSNTKRTKTAYMQHSTGTPGAKAQTLIKKWNSASSNVAVEFIIDDTGIYQCLPIGIRSWHCAGTGNNTHVGCEICEPENARMLDANWLALSKNSKNNTAYAVRALQQELKAQGYDPNGVDGVFGPGCESAVKAFQKDKGLTVDGSVGLKTLHELQKREGSYLLYNINENQAYFEDVYKKAVYTCAYVLKKIGQDSIDNYNVCSHSEGYKLKIASNHADVGHWWPKHGKTMNDFRQDVKTYLTTGKLPYEKETKPTVETPFEKAETMGLFDDFNATPTKTVTFEQLAVVLNRLNLLK